MGKTWRAGCQKPSYVSVSLVLLPVFFEGNGSTDDPYYDAHLNQSPFGVGYFQNTRGHPEGSDFEEGFKAEMKDARGDSKQHLLKMLILQREFKDF